VSTPKTSGDPEDRIATITQLFEDHADATFNVGRRIVWNRSDAEDVVQATFIQAFLRLDQVQDPSRARAWLLKVAYHQAITVLRRRKDDPVDPQDLPEGSTPPDDTGDRVVRSELAATVRTAIDALPETLRVAIVLRDVEGLAMAEVADVLDISASAAKMRVARARERLRIALQGRI
jgi:RNA polymerase sigma-70 factor (ECF subfamily)